MTSKHTATALHLILGASAFCFAVAPAYAQQGPAPSPQQDERTPDTVVVTGTSIKGVAAVGSPTQAVTAEELQETGLGNTNDMLKTLPAFVNLGIDEGRGGSTQGAVGNITQASTVNLRGLGPESTLVLLDGRRIGPSGSQGQFYDTSVFPANAISRIEVVADGASAIYGSEAVGGVVNFVTRRGSDGSETRLRAGVGDGYHSTTVGQTFGLDWGSGDVFAAYEHYERSGLLGSARPQVTQDLRPFGGPDLRTNFASPGTIVVGSTTYAVPTGTNGRGLTAGQLVAGTRNLSDTYDSKSLLNEQVRDSLYVSANQNITDNLEVWASGYYSNRDYEGEGLSLNGGAATATLTVPRANPFFVHPTNPAATSVQVNYSFENDFRAIATGGEEGVRAAAGLTWEIFGDWSLDAWASFNENEASRLLNGQVRTPLLNAALADTNPATAFNPFCDRLAFECNNAATIAAMQGFSFIGSEIRVKDVAAKASGSLFQLPGGPVRAAIGVEYTKSEGRFANSRNTTTTAAVTPIVYNPQVNREVQAAFAEVLVPIVGDANAVPGVRRLELSVAGRFEDYSDFGETTNPKYGVRWDPLDGLTLRGSWGTSFHAPTLFAIDPIPTTGPGATNVLDPTTNAQIRAIVIQGPRPGLQPEEATTWSLGAEYTPPQLPGLRLSANYYDIDYQNRFASLPAATLLANEASFPALVIRNPSLALVQQLMADPYYSSAQEPPANIRIVIDQRTSNLGGIRQRGLDLSASHEWDLSIGQLTIGADANLVLDAQQADAVAFPYRDVLDTINNPLATRGRARVSWSNDGWRANAFWNYVGSYTNNVTTPNRKVADWNTFDASFSYTFEGPGIEGLQLGLSVTNLTDRAPPIVINTQAGVIGGYDPANASILGREIALTVSKKW